MGFKFTHPESNSGNAAIDIVDASPFATRLSPDGHAAWEDFAREKLLHRLPIRASLIALVGTSLSTASPLPVMAAVTNLGGVCSVTDETDTVAAMADATCLSVLVDHPITLTQQVAVTKSIDLRETITFDAALNGFGQLVVESGTVVISGADSATSVLLRGSSTQPLIRTGLGDPQAVALTLSGLRLAGGLTVANAAMVEVSPANNRGSLTLHTVTIASHSSGGGAALNIFSGGLESLTVRDSLFLDNSNNFLGGGAIRADGVTSVEVTESQFLGNDDTNSASGRGGAIFAENVGTLSVKHSRFYNNSSGDVGGAMSAVNVDSVSIVGTSFEANSSSWFAGGIHFSDVETVTVVDSLVSSNTTYIRGGGIYFSDVRMASISNSTLVDNQAVYRGGAIFAVDTNLHLRHSTIALNSADQGGGLYARDTSTLHLSHTLLLGNTADPGLGSDLRVRSGGALPELNFGYSILSQAPSTSTLSDGWTLAESGTVFGLTPSLAENGGPTKTLALQTASPNPAINSGDPILTAGVNGETTDQRGAGFNRVSGGRIDIGAFEVQAVAAPPVTETPAPRPVEPLLPSVIPSLAISESTLTCTIGDFSDAPEFVDVTLVVGGVRQETRRIAMPATTVTWPVDSLWRGQSVGCEVVARVENRVATAYAPGISVPSATTPAPTPTPTPTTPTPTTPAEPARGFAAASIRFAPLSSALDAANRRAIASLVEQAGIDATFRVNGYVQAIGSTRNDRALSLARAQAVAAELRRLGVAAANITAIGGGRSQRDGAAARRATITARWTK